MFLLFRAEPETKCSNSLFVFLISIISSLVCAGLSFLAYFTSPTSCSNLNILSLQQWIFGSAIAYCIISLFSVSIFGIPYKIGAVFHFGYLFFVNLPFTIAWNILGAIILFRDSNYCREIYPNLWYIS